MEIAVISVACRFPGAENVHQFWENLSKGKCSISDMPIELWQQWSASFSNLSAIDSMNKQGGYLKDTDSFDAAFFKIKEEEAQLMDPQQRLGLELAYETLQASNWENHKHKKIGVIVGITYSGYADLMRNQVFSGQIESEAVTAGNLPNFIAARISNQLDLKGPSMVIDSACSSSLTAIQIAIDNIRSRQCDLALAGGIFLQTSPSVNVALHKAGALSKKETYRIFDEQSDGIFLGEGGGFILLKPLKKAEADGDAILGVIRNLSLNNDGKSISILAPKASTQQALLEECYQKMEISPLDINYLETHGTGTGLGDATEARSLGRVYKNTPSLYIGSVKANIGHLLSASGMASVIKVLGMLIHRQFYPMINLKTVRKSLPLRENMLFNQQLIEPKNGAPIIAAINSFGFGGTNAHLILEEYTRNKDLQLGFTPVKPDYNKKKLWFTEKNYNGEQALSTPKIKVFRSGWQNVDYDQLETESKHLIHIFCNSEHQSIANRIQSSFSNDKVQIGNYSNIDDCSPLAGDIIFLFPNNFQLLRDSLSKLSKLSFKKPIRLFLVTQKAIVWKEGNEKYRVEDFLISGVCFAALSAFPSIKITQLDLFDLKETVPAIIPLLKSSQYHYLTLWRNKQYWTPNFAEEKVSLPSKNPIVSKGVYLITGGATGIGARMAVSLAKKNNAIQLVIAGRRPLEDLQEWEQLSTTLATLGTQVDYFQGDVTKEAAIKALFNHIELKYGQLNGIIHAAGILQIQIWEKLTLSQFNATLAPKVEGTILINRQLQEKKWKPDFALTFSSISSCLPNLGKGLSAYVTANFFLDQYTKYLSQQNPFWKVINWGMWEQTGMSKYPKITEQMANYGLPSLQADEASQLLSMLLGIKQSQLAVFNHTIPLSQVLHVKQLSPKLVVKSASEISIQPAELRAYLRNIIAEELEMPPEEIGFNDNLLNMGLDSLMVMDLAVKIESLGYQELPFELFYDYPSIDELVNALANKTKEDTGHQIISTLVPDSENSELPLSTSQLAFVKAQSVSEAPNFSFIRFTVENTLDVKILSQSIHQLIQRHPILRTNFHYELKKEGIHFWQTIRSIAFYKDLALIKKINKTDSLKNIENEFVNRPFDLKRDALFRFALVQEANIEHLLICAHHSIVDGWSLRVLAQDLFQLYESIQKGRQIQLPVITAFLDWIQSPDKLIRQAANTLWWQQYINHFSNESKDSFIYKLFKLKTPILHQPSASYTFSVPNELNQHLELISKKEKIPLSILFKAHYVKTLSIWLKQSSLIINIADLNRSSPIKNIREAVGCFSEAYPLLINCEPNDSLTTLAKRIQKKWAIMKENSPYDASKIAQFIKDAGKQVMVFGFSFNSFTTEWADQFSTLEFIESNTRGFTAQTRFSIQLWKERALTKVTVNVPKDLLEEHQLNEFKSIFLQTTKEQKTKALLQQPILNNVLPNLVQNEILWKIRNHATYHPNSIALITEAESISYYQLEQRVARLAGALTVQGVTRGTVVGFVGSNSQKSIISLLAIWRLGGVWLPIDEKYPIPRIEEMLAIAKTSLLILESSMKHNFSKPHYTYAQLMVEDYSAQFLCPISINQPIYILFTSGTSGQPKAIPIFYPSLLNNFSWFARQFDINARDVFAFLASISFDTSLRQILLPLQLGASTHILSKNTKRNASLISSFIREKKITIWHSVPALFENFLQATEQNEVPAYENLRLIMLGGETLSPQLIRRWQKRFGLQQTFVNLYGPTETTINITFHVINKLLPDTLNTIAIGKPITNAEILLLNEKKEIAEKGELLIAGPMLSSGYLGQTALNEEKFIWFKNKRYYRTGDLASKNEAGILSFHGRIDRQIKIRGIRIEPAEIEYHLLQISGITKAFVDSFLLNKVSELVAIIETQRDDLDIAEIKKLLSAHLSPSLLPHKVVSLKSFPLLPNAKTDVIRLKNQVSETYLSKTTFHEEQILPQTEKLIHITKEKLITIWERILGTKVKNSEDSFFDLGGDSLNVMVLFLELEKAGWTQLPSMGAFYKDSRFSTLVKFLNEAQQTSKSSKVEVTSFSLSPAQLGFYYSGKQAQGNFANWKAGYYLDGSLVIDLFKKTLEIICRRHLMLQVKLQKDRPPTFAKVDKPFIKFQFTDISQLDKPKVPVAIAKYLEAKQQEQIDIYEYPLVKMHIIRISNNRHLWFITAHHIIADGISSLILGQEIMQLYSALNHQLENPLTPLKRQFPDYIEFLKRQNKTDKSLNFWLPHFQKKYVPPQLPVKEGATIDFWLLKEELEYPEAFESKLSTALILCFYRTLRHFMKQEDLIIGIPVHGRPSEFPDIHSMVGCFAQAIPLRMNKKHITLDELEAFTKDAITHEFPLQALKKRLPYSIPIAKLMGSQFFFSFIDITAFEPKDANGLTIDWPASFSNYKPSGKETDILLTVRKIKNQLTANFAFESRHFAFEDAQKIIQQFKAEWIHLTKPFNFQIQKEPLSIRGTGDLDTALIGYLPSLQKLKSFLPNKATISLKTAHQFIAPFFPNHKPIWLEFQKNELGRTGYLSLPFFAEEINHKNAKSIIASILEAMELASKLGAKVVSLAGQLASVTAYGKEIQTVGQSQKDLPILTTGHQTTVAGVVKTVIKAVAACGRSLKDSTVAFIGLGSIGSAVATTLLQFYEHPSKLLLFDRPAAKKRLQNLEEYLRQSIKYKGDIKIYTSKKGLENHLYNADIIVSAVSGHQIVVDVERLKPGTILIDDSFPHCFSESLAKQRMLKEQDVLILGGGLFAIQQIERKLYLPFGNKQLSGIIQQQFMPNAMPGCQLESLILVQNDDLVAPTLSLVDFRKKSRYLELINQLSIDVAPLHLGDFIISLELLHALTEIIEQLRTQNL